MTAPRHARNGVRKRFKALTSSLATLSLVAAGAVGLASTASAADVPLEFSEKCGSIADLYENPPRGLDTDSSMPLKIYDGVTTYVGGKLTAGHDVAELEGLSVVNGDFEYLKNVVIGRVIGSSIVPDSERDALLVGGNVVNPNGIALNMDGGHKAQLTGPSNSVYAGWMVDNGDISVDLGSELALTTENYTPAFDFSNYTSRVEGLSDALTAVTNEGSVSLDGAELILDGSDAQSGDLLAFNVTEAEITAANSLRFVGLPSDQPVVINVAGTNPSFQVTTFYAEYVNEQSKRLDEFENLGYASRVMWNFHEAETVDIKPSSQMVGSIVVPAGDLIADSHINGQVFVAGDFTYGTRDLGQGLEVHAFPWIGCVTPVDVDPEPEPDPIKLTVTKVVEGADPGPDQTYTFQAGIDDSGMFFDIQGEGSYVFEEYTPFGTLEFSEENPDIDGFTLDGINYEVVGAEGQMNGDVFEVELNGEDVEIIVTNTFSETPEPEVPGVVSVTGSVIVEGDCCGSSCNDFSLTYQVEGEESVTVPFNADGSVDLPEFEAGTKVTFSTDAPDLDGLESGSVTINGSQDPVEVTIVEGENPGLEVAFGYDCVQDPVTSDVVVDTEVKINGQCELPEDATFTITYVIDGETHTETVDPNGSFTIDDLPTGTEVTFNAEAPEFEGLENGKVVINNGNNTITVGEETTTINIAYEYDCQETPEPVEVEDVVVDLTVVDATCELPDGAGFVVEYSYEGADGQTVTGSETLTAGETSFSVEDVPVGTEVTFTVGAPADVDGVLTVDGNTSDQTVVTVTDGGNTVNINFAQE